MSLVLFAVFVLLAAAGVALQVRSGGEMRRFAVGSGLVLASLPVFTVAWLLR